MAIELISKIKPKNNGEFKLVDVEDIEYNGKGLDEAIKSLRGKKEIRVQKVPTVRQGQKAKRVHRYA